VAEEVICLLGDKKQREEGTRDQVKGMHTSSDPFLQQGATS
jgi:hypothetical protein